MAKQPKQLRLGDVLRKWRVMTELDLRTAAGQMGIGAATLMRIEHGQSCDAETLLKVLNWLMSTR